jgi:ferredoxin
MAGKGSSFTRRRFMIAGSAAIASPLILGAAGSMVGVKSAEAKTSVTNIKKGKGEKIYFIGHGCVGCHVCMAFCPAEAIHFGDTGNEIDQNKCEHCGTCYEECPISVVTETEF